MRIARHASRLATVVLDGRREGARLTAPKALFCCLSELKGRGGSDRRHHGSALGGESTKRPQTRVGTAWKERSRRSARRNYVAYKGLREDGFGYFTVSTFAVPPCSTSTAS